MKKHVTGYEPRLQSREKFLERRETVLAIMKDKNYRPMRRRDLAVLMNVSGPEKDALAEVLLERMEKAPDDEELVNILGDRLITK